MGGLGAVRELCFQTWRAPRPPERRQKCTKRGFRGIMDACESFVGNPPWPEECFCDENIINKMFISKTAPSPICSKRVAQRGLKASFWSPFGHFGPSRSGLWTTLGATERQQDAALCTDAFPGPKVVPDPLPNRRERQGRRVCGQ